MSSLLVLTPQVGASVKEGPLPASGTGPSIAQERVGNGGALRVNMLTPWRSVMVWGGGTCRRWPFRERVPKVTSLVTATGTGAGVGATMDVGCAARAAARRSSAARPPRRGRSARRAPGARRAASARSRGPCSPGSPDHRACPHLEMSGRMRAGSPSRPPPCGPAGCVYGVQYSGGATGCARFAREDGRLAVRARGVVRQAG